ncbi:Deoxyribonuclease Tat-D [Lasiodiplodia hormozganensis]|uniref:Deoxyribonuclease Tat-D n=1 Tax=Lasiodiplodia hormozganensis TaxID=869390 RepID=A0AA39U3G0_9PEZI|nr:Deoxyribonuclease Tat-D [Lasiodiplodia hormozganensis]
MLLARRITTNPRTSTTITAASRRLSTTTTRKNPRPSMLTGFPTAAPAAPSKPLRYADVAVTPTAPEFTGVYRGKQQHPADFHPSVLDRAAAAGVRKVMLTGMHLADVVPNLALCAARPEQCSLTIGVHPYHAAEPWAAECNEAGGKGEVGGEGWESNPYLAQLASHVRDALALGPTSPLSAFGELGLDWDKTAHVSKDLQLRTFRAQLDMFVREGWDLPLFLHCRAAFDDFIREMTPYLDKLPRRGLVHSFVGSRAEMEALVGLGFDVSVNGFSFATRESLEMVAAVPLERLQIETDAPWGEIKPGAEVAKRYCGNAPPLPQNKKKDKWDAACMVKERNESCAISRVAFVVAGLKGMNVEEVAEAAWRNSVEMFGLERGE